MLIGLKPLINTTNYFSIIFNSAPGEDMTNANRYKTKSVNHS